MSTPRAITAPQSASPEDPSRLTALETADELSYANENAEEIRKTGVFFSNEQVAVQNGHDAYSSSAAVLLVYT